MPPKDEPHKPSKAAKAIEADEAFYYKRQPHRALAGFHGLSQEQRGFYATLIELNMHFRGPLADNDVENARAFGCDLRLFKRLKRELLELERIHVEDGLLFDEFAVRELVRMGLYSESQSRRAKARWSKAKTPKLKVVSLDDRRRAKTDLRPTLSPTVPDSVPRTVSPKSERFLNEINGPRHARIEEKRISLIEPSKSPNDAAARFASPPLTGGEPRIEKKAKRREALDALAVLKTKSGASDEQSEEGSEGNGEAAPAAPGDRKAVRT